MLNGDRNSYTFSRPIYLYAIDPEQALKVFWGCVLQAALLKIPAENVILILSSPTPHQANFYCQQFAVSNNSLVLAIYCEAPDTGKSGLEKRMQSSDAAWAQRSVNLLEHDWRGTTSAWLSTKRFLCFPRQNSLLHRLLFALLLLTLYFASYFVSLVCCCCFALFCLF